MTTLTQLLDAPQLRDRIDPITGVVADQPVLGLTVLEDVGHIRTGQPHTLAIITPAATKALEYYKLDMVIRVAASRPLPAILFVGPDPPAVSTTGRELANRADLALVAAPRSTLSELLLPIAREIEGDAAAALQRLFELAQQLRVLSSEPATTDVLVQATQALTNRTIDIDTIAPTAATIEMPVAVNDRTEMKLSAERTWDLTEDREIGIALQLLADSVARVIASTRRKEGIPMSSRSEVLTQLLIAGDPQRESLLRRAHAIGVPVDGWHVVASLDFENVLDIVDHDEIAAYELGEELVRQVLNSLGGDNRIWHTARFGLSALLIHTWRHEPGPLAARDIAQTFEGTLDRVVRQHPGLVLRCGVGSMHAGVQGLRASTLEAQAGLTEARRRNYANRPVLFDATNIRRGLIEWYASDTAREAARHMLAPLDRQTATEREKIIRTLSAYLDSGGSVVRASEKLFLHRNAVAYRLKRAVMQLGIDLEDPDQRLMLHLACRAELLRPAEDRHH